jgi:hypothetical protein
VAKKETPGSFRMERRLCGIGIASVLGGLLVPSNKGKRYHIDDHEQEQHQPKCLTRSRHSPFGQSIFEIYVPEVWEPKYQQSHSWLAIEVPLIMLLL